MTFNVDRLVSNTQEPVSRQFSGSQSGAMDVYAKSLDILSYEQRDYLSGKLRAGYQIKMGLATRALIGTRMLKSEFTHDRDTEAKFFFVAGDAIMSLILSSVYLNYASSFFAYLTPFVFVLLMFLLPVMQFMMLAKRGMRTEKMDYAYGIDYMVEAAERAANTLRLSKVWKDPEMYSNYERFDLDKTIADMKDAARVYTFLMYNGKDEETLKEIADGIRETRDTLKEAVKWAKSLDEASIDAALMMRVDKVLEKAKGSREVMGQAHKNNELLVNTVQDQQEQAKEIEA